MALAANREIYEVSQWQSAAWAVGSAGFVLGTLSLLWLGDDLPDLRVLPPMVRWPLLLAVAAVFGMLCWHYLRLVLRPDSIAIDDEGIEGWSSFSMQRGLWRDFDRFVWNSGEEGNYVKLHFRSGADENPKALVISLGGRPGLNQDLVVADATGRLRQLGIDPYQPRRPPVEKQ